MVTKNILIFEAYPFFSGAQRVSLNLCKVLKSSNHKITLLLADDPTDIHRKMFGPYVDEIFVIGTSKSLKQYGNSEQWFKISNFIITLFIGLIPFYWHTIKFIKKNKFDVIYFCDPRGAVMMFLPCIFFSGKKICYLQGKNKYNKLFAKMIYLLVTDHLICPSYDVLRSLPPSDKKTVLNYGIDFSQYSIINNFDVQKEINKILPLHYHNKTKLLYVGLIRPQKGIHHLIKALKEIKNIKSEAEMPILFILGESTNEHENLFQLQLIKFCKSNSLDNFVYWLGWKNNVLEWMKNSDYFIFPTIDKEQCNLEGFDKVIESSEGSPVVLIESSLCNLYSLASKVTGVNETITDNYNGLMYDPNEKNGLRNGILNLLEKRPKFIDFPNREKFSQEIFAKKVIKLFND